MNNGYARCSTNETKQDINRQVRELKAAGAGFYIEALTEEQRQAKKEREDALGFFEVPEEAQKPQYPQTPYMGRVQGLANQTIIVKTTSGMYEVSYDRNGYAVKASKVDWRPEG